MMKEMIKKVGVSAFARGGIDRIAVRLHARDALVLAYHAILSEEKGEPFRYHHTVDEFEAHLDWLGANCTPVGLADFARWKRGEWQPRKPPILLTFDDGFRNNAALAAPLLIKKGFPALFFIVSGYIDGARVLWPDDVFARVLAWTGASIDDPNGTVRVVPQSREDRRTLALSMVEACKRCADARRLEFMAYVARETPQCNPLLDLDVQAFMTWDEVRALSAAGFDLGSHTVTHPILSNLEPQQLHEELLGSRAAIEMHTGLACTALAYPNGLSRDFSDLVVAATARAGYDFAFTVSNRWCPRTCDPLRLDRVGPPGHRDVSTFALHASGCRQWFPQ